VEIDASAAVEGLSLSADVCIVGAGPIGLSLAEALGQDGREIILIESGGRNPRHELVELNTGEGAGDADPLLTESRCRGPGGTAALWNTALYGAMSAKYTALDPIDFQSRSRDSRHAWPFAKAALEPWYAQAAAVVGNVPADPPGIFSGADRGPIEFPSAGLVNGTYWFGRPAVFTDTMPARLRSASNVVLLSGATVTRLSAARDRDRVGEIGWRSLSGRSGIVRASTCVLAAGGIENARLLLAAADFDFATRSHWLGRGFMEHPVDGTLQLTTEMPELCPAPGYYGPHADDRGRCVMGRLGLAEDLLRMEDLPNASLRLIPDFEPESRAIRWLNAAGRRLQPMPVVHRPLAAIGTGARRSATRRPRTYRLLVDLEQAPHPENRIMLSDGVDRLGQPRVKLRWEWGQEDERQRQRSLAVVTRELERNGMRVARRTTGPGFNTCSHHHVGATRMHPDPDDGVVDENLRVHGMENLFVAGSSVFPTAGWANPTLTAIALTLRLAGHLGRAG